MSDEKKPRVLLIDDSPIVLEALREELEGPFEIETAGDGSAGLALLETFQPEVVISDLHMPKLNGIELVRAMRVHAPLIPVMIVTDHGGVEKVVEAMREGAVGYILKGMSGNLLIQEVHRALAYRQLLEENRKLEETNKNYQRGLEKMVEEKTAEILKLQQFRAEAEKLAAVGTLVAGMAHEINNPIAVVIANANWMEQEIDNSLKSLNQILSGATQVPTECTEWGKIREILSTGVRDPIQEFPQVLKDTLDSSQRIARIVHSLRRISEPRDAVGKCELLSAIRKAKAAVGEDLTGRANLVEQIAPSLSEIPMLEEDFVAIVTNLLSNSAHAVERGRGHIELNIARDGEEILLWVRDNGCGIPPEDLKKIFEPFFTTKRPGKGMGLGLSLVQQIVRQCGGSFSVESEVGKGTTMTVRLPSVVRPIPLARAAGAAPRLGAS